jgi:hypothetical protein
VKDEALNLGTLTDGVRSAEAVDGAVAEIAGAARRAVEPAGAVAGPVAARDPHVEAGRGAT